MTEYEKWLTAEGAVRDDWPFSDGFKWFGPGLSNFRAAAIARFSFAIPNDEAIAAIAAEGPVLEVGAGTGYWAHELRAVGCDVITTDPEPHSDNNTVPTHRYGEVVPLDADSAIGRFGAGRALLTVWPSLGRHQWPEHALRNYAGRTVVYVGEGPGGCTGSDLFHAMLAEQFVERAVVRIPTWAGIHDALHVYDRKPG